MGSQEPEPDTPHSHRRGRHRLKRGDNMTAFRSRPTRIGRIEEPTGPFKLRPDIEAPGNYSLVKAIQDVTRDWKRQARNGTVAESTIRTNCHVLVTLGRYAKARRIRKVSDLSAAVIGEWMRAPSASTDLAVSVTTQQNRRAVCGRFFTTCICLGITDVTPLVAVPKKSRPLRHIRPFTPDEIDRLKEFAHRGNRAGKSPAALALMLIGASPGEVGSITAADIHFENLLVRAHGGGERYTDRWLPIDDEWALLQLANRVSWLKTSRPDWENEYVAYAPNSKKKTTFESRCAATSMTIIGILRRARLNIQGETRAASITEYLATDLFIRTGRVEVVAARLGIKSLDETAKLVRYNWRDEYTAQPPKRGE